VTVTADGPLADVLAKSATGSGLRRPESLAEHSAATRHAATTVARRVSSAGLIGCYPRFWAWAEMAALLHDTGKVAEGFQRQLQPGGGPWGERHEVLSLAYADLLTAALPALDRAMIIAGIAFHHRCLDGTAGRGLSELYPPEADWERKFGKDPDAPDGKPTIQVTPARHAALVAWLAVQLGADVPAAADRKLWQRAKETFAFAERHWRGPLSPEEGLLAVLLQGAVTLADHAASAHVRLEISTPLPFCYIGTVASPYQHQTAAAETDGHLILLAPTGTGKTEAGLAWASRQMPSMSGLPRLAWILPYRASIDAAADRFARDLDKRPGKGLADIGVLHGTAAISLLARAVDDDRAPGPADARKARACVTATRLFAQRVRVTTPHQLLRAAIAGPRYASVLLEQANSLMVLDELHAYDPATFGRICAAMRLWETLGSRVAVLSATLAPPMIDLITDSLTQAVTLHHAPAGAAPLRHRLALDSAPLMTPSSLKRITGWLADGLSVLAVTNTVAAAQQLFRELADAGPGAHPRPGDTLLLHSRFRYRDRAGIEALIKARHPERQPGDPARRGGGLVVATQALEVSLCLDFDRGVTELAPVEAIAQRAGRVNRRGRHPEGPTEFRVHDADSARPYEPGAIDAARQALTGADGALITEQTIEDWLALAYDTPWGQEWADQARYHRNAFAEAFLTFTEPFADRSEYAARLEQEFDTTEIVLAADADEYRELAFGPDGDPLLAAGLFIPIRWNQRKMLSAAGRAAFDPDLAVWLVDAPYDLRTGLNLAPDNSGSPGIETIL
jgi:CRISPR-associated endonuclease/helicase Cas3